MLKKTITYTDYNDIERTEDFYFNLNKAEVAEWNFKNNGSLDIQLQRLLNKGDMEGILKVYKDIILAAYGEKSDDGKRFIKSEQLSKEFSETEAFANLYVDLLSDNGSKIVAFIKGILPKDYQKTLSEMSEDDLKKAAADNNVKVDDNVVKALVDKGNND
jgi:hypothetical protein